MHVLTEAASVSVSSALSEAELVRAEAPPEELLWVV